ncbi:MAG: type I-C CRISPR-associated endonuclease Cas1c [Oscillospiraceae bacterium]|nr:type I-C CRISPR-associated endonuclease Cas1c [Oscillospiraceae bacterium]
MKKLLNTLYVTLPSAYLVLDGENVVIMEGEEKRLRVPLHNLEQIVTFGYAGASPALMGACAKRGVSITFLTMHGRFLARVLGDEHGNVLMRKEQYRRSDSEEQSGGIARNILIGKLHNSRWVLERTARDYPLRVDAKRLQEASQSIAQDIERLRETSNLDSLRGIEGEAAAKYFSVFNEMILQNKDEFWFNDRNRRPPRDNVNALLSFVYTLLANDMASALTTVGLDSYVGFLHRDRSGRRSLALDLSEELRAPVADRFVLSMINMRKINGSDFLQKENGAVLMGDDTRKAVLTAWQKRKQEELTHPYLKEKITWGLVPHAQALLFARMMRNDLEAYPPFLWK